MRAGQPPDCASRSIAMQRAAMPGAVVHGPAVVPGVAACRLLVPLASLRLRCARYRINLVSMIWPLRFVLLCLAGSLFFAPARAAERVVLSVDRVMLDAQSPTPGRVARVDFQQGYATVPAVFVLPDESNGDPSTVRIVSVDTTGFEVLLAEPSSEDGATAPSTIEYLAVEPFARSTGGVELEAAVIPALATEEGKLIPGSGRQRVTFSRAKNGIPVVLAQLQSRNNQPGLAGGTAASPWITTLVVDADSTGFDIALERSEDGLPLVAPERVAWFAIDADVNFDFPDTDGVDVAARSTLTGNNVVGHDNGCRSQPLGRTFPVVPRLFGNKVTRNGPDGGWLRRCGVTRSAAELVVDEDRLSDSERSHTSERAGLVAFERDFTARREAPQTGRKPFDGEVGTAFLAAASGIPPAFTRVSFPNSFDAGVTPLVFATPTETDPAPATLRLRAVDATGFDVAALEPDGELGAHDAMTIDYVAVEPGTHRLDDGRRIEAGFVDTQAFQASGVGGTSWGALAFSAGLFSAPPALVTQIQTMANEPLPSATSRPFLTSAVRNLSTGGAELALERSEATSGAVVAPERIGWLATERAVRGVLLARDDATVSYDFSAGATVGGFDDGCFAVPFTSAFPTPPLMVADKNSRNGNNGGWLRRCSPPTTTSVGLHVDEDRFRDAERSHTAETTSVLAFGRGFDWGPSSPVIVLTKSSAVRLDPVNGTSSPKRIPGALVDYTIAATNTDKAATDADSVEIVDLLPEGLALFLGDLGGGAPFVFVDGAEASGLAFAFTAVDDPTDDVEFTADAAADPVDWNYQPSPVDGFDPLVDGFRIRLRGAFLGRTATTPPAFTLRYSVRVD